MLLLFSDGCPTSTRGNITETKRRNYFYRVYYQENHQFNLIYFYQSVQYEEIFQYSVYKTYDRQDVISPIYHNSITGHIA